MALTRLSISGAAPEKREGEVDSELISLAVIGSAEAEGNPASTGQQGDLPTHAGSDIPMKATPVPKMTSSRPSAMMD